MGNIRSLQLLRNSTIYESKEAAKAALESASGLTGVSPKDGVPVLARYKSGNVVKTLVGVYADGLGGAASGMTIIDVEGSASSVEELKQEINAKLGDGITSGNTATKQLQDLSGTTDDTSATTSVAGAKKYADEKVRAALDALDATTVADDNKVVSDVTQADGQITATAKNVTEVKLAGLSATADTKIAAADTLGDALAKLQGQINSMDKVASSADGEVVITVVEADGKVTEEKSKLKDVLLTGYAKTNDTGDIAAIDSVNVALSKLENKAAAITIANDDKSINVTTSATGTNINVNIKSEEHVLAKDGNAGLYTNIALSSITPSSTTVKEEYQLTATDGTKLGDSIKIYKDSSLVSIEYITDPADTNYQNLKYVYVDNSGNTKTEYVDISSLVLEAEFASGVTVTGHVAHGVVDSNSEKDSSNNSFLTVGADGFKVSGIKDEIDAKINALDATGGTQTIATDKHVAVEVIEADGKITNVNVAEGNIADADDLAGLSAKTVTEIVSSNNSITAASSATASDGTVKYDVITDASKIQMSGFTSTSIFSGITTSSSITEAFKEVESVVEGNELVTSAALNDLDNKIAELSGGSSTDLAAEITRAKAAESEIATKVGLTGAESARTWSVADASYASGDTVNASVKNLDTQLKAVSDNYVSGATMNGKTVAKQTGNANILAFSATTATSALTSADVNAIVIQTGDDGTLTFGLNYIDAGTY